MSLKEAVTYWKLRLLVNALEKIAIPDEPKPGISVSMKMGLKQILAEATIRQISPENDVSVKQETEYDSTELKNHSSDAEELDRNLTDKKTLVQLNNWVNVEIKKVAEEVVGAYKWKLERSEDGRDKELLKKLTTHSNPLDIISDKIVQEMVEEANLNAEVEKWTRIRDAEKEACRTSASEMSNLLKDYNNELTSGRYASVMNRYRDFVDPESQFLNNKQTLAKMQQKIAENPPELIQELESSYKLLLDSQDRIYNVIQDLSNRKAKYAALGPEFIALLADWNEYGQLIQQKEFVLNGMDSVANNEQSFNVSLNSSLVFESP